MKLDVAEPTTATLDDLTRWLSDFDARVALAQPKQARTPLVVTPLGLSDRERLWSELKTMGLEPSRPEPVVHWPRVSTALQVRARTSTALRRAALFEAGWALLSPEGRAEVWWLSTDDAAQLVTAKHLLRSHFETLAVDFGGQLHRPVKLHAFHLPDADDFLSSAVRLETALALLGAPAT
ncbi:MAG: hypothetical protein SFW67_05645 [Myxococcaceae bacterium]|nr:hypothetical protein [Myxococcaceae bacterium]